MIYVHDESIPKKKAFSRRASKSFGEAAERTPAMALDTPRIGTRLGATP